MPFERTFFTLNRRKVFFTEVVDWSPRNWTYSLTMAHLGGIPCLPRASLALALLASALA